jgi:hypothetical protein
LELPNRPTRLQLGGFDYTTGLFILYGCLGGSSAFGGSGGGLDGIGDENVVLSGRFGADSVGVVFSREADEEDDEAALWLLLLSLWPRSEERLDDLDDDDEPLLEGFFSISEDDGEPEISVAERGMERRSEGGFSSPDLSLAASSTESVEERDGLERGLSLSLLLSRSLLLPLLLRVDAGLSDVVNEEDDGEGTTAGDDGAEVGLFGSDAGELGPESSTGRNFLSCAINSGLRESGASVVAL